MKHLILDEWDPQRSSLGLKFDKSDPTSVSQEYTKGWKYAVSKTGMEKGCHFWHIKYVYSSRKS